MTIAIVDYDICNVGSIRNMIEKIGFRCEIVTDYRELARFEKIILPGVGSYDVGVNNLKAKGFYDAILRQVKDTKVTLLGICLGMQLLFQGSEEGTQAGLGIFNGHFKKFDSLALAVKVPHMGWNSVRVIQPNHLLESESENRFYFVHSYYLADCERQDILGVTNFGLEFPSVVRKGNVYGFQFHPEKSHRFGMNLLVNFCKLEASC